MKQDLYPWSRNFLKAKFCANYESWFMVVLIIPYLFDGCQWYADCTTKHAQFQGIQVVGKCGTALRLPHQNPCPNNPCSKVVCWVIWGHLPPSPSVSCSQGKGKKGIYCRKLSEGQHYDPKIELNISNHHLIFAAWKFLDQGWGFFKNQNHCTAPTEPVFS